MDEEVIIEPSVRIEAEDTRYPMVVITGPFGTVGYTLSLRDGSLDRVCICHAYNSSECLCGAWDALKS